MLRAAMRTLFIVALLVSVSACKEGESFKDEPNAPTIDTKTAEWDDGPKPTPDPPLDADEDAGLDAGSDAGPDAG